MRVVVSDKICQTRAKKCSLTTRSTLCQWYAYTFSALWLAHILVIQHFSKTVSNRTAPNGSWTSQIQWGQKCVVLIRLPDQRRPARGIQERCYGCPRICATNTLLQRISQRICRLTDTTIWARHSSNGLMRLPQFSRSIPDNVPSYRSLVSQCAQILWQVLLSRWRDDVRGGGSCQRINEQH